MVLRKRVIISDIWFYGDKILKIGVAPIVDPYIKVEKSDPERKSIIGAIVIAYAQTSKSALQDKGLLGTEIAYYDANRVVASSFTRGVGGEEDTAKAKQLSEVLARGTLSETQNGQRVTVGDTDYLVAVVKLPRAATRSCRRRRSTRRSPRARWC